ncbi:MAG: hypothetical protein U1F41_07525 [Burkholderiales bacterium]
MRRLREHLRFLEQLDEAPGVRGLAAEHEVALRVLALGHRLDLELREPGVVRKDPAHGVDHGERTRERVLALDGEVVVCNLGVELRAQVLRDGRLGAGFVGLRRQLLQVVPLLPQRDHDRRERHREEQDEGDPDVEAPQDGPGPAQIGRQQVEPRLGGLGGRTRDHGGDFGAPGGQVLERGIDHGAPRRGQVDGDGAASGVAVDHDRVEVELLGLERRVAVEVVRERLVQVLFDGEGQRDPLAQAFVRSEAHDHARRAAALRQCRDRGHAVAFASERHLPDRLHDRDARFHRGAPQRGAVLRKRDHRPHPPPCHRGARPCGYELAELAAPPLPEAGEPAPAGCLA